jgi:hypothetical protein
MSALRAFAEAFDEPEEPRMRVRYRPQLAQRVVNRRRVGQCLTVFDGPHLDPDHHGTSVDALVDLGGHETPVVHEVVAHDFEDALQKLRLECRIDSPEINQHGGLRHRHGRQCSPGLRLRPERRWITGAARCRPSAFDDGELAADLGYVNRVRARGADDDHESLAETRECGEQNREAAGVQRRDVPEVEHDRVGRFWINPNARLLELVCRQGVELSRDKQMQAVLVARAGDRKLACIGVDHRIRHRQVGRLAVDDSLSESASA